jgi:hypothetical protein
MVLILIMVSKASAMPGGEAGWLRQSPAWECFWGANWKPLRRS